MYTCSLTKLLDTTKQCLSTFECLDIPIETWDAIVIHIDVAVLTFLILKH